MANKRQYKKNLKKAEQKQKRIKTFKNVSRETITKSKKYLEQLALTNKKYQALSIMGIDPKYLTTTNLRKVKVKDIPKDLMNPKKKVDKNIIPTGNINKINYPFLYEENKISKDTKKKVRQIGEKVYRLPKGKGIYFAYMDISGEQDFEDLLKRYNRKSTNELLEKIKGLLNTLPQFDKELYKKSKGQEGTSSGKCGVANFHLTDIDKIEHIDKIDRKKENNRLEYNPNRKRTHSGNNKYWQTLTDRNGNIYFTEFTLHSLLTVVTAILDNIFEVDRFDFYDDVYTQVTRYFEELADILPSPVILN